MKIAFKATANITYNRPLVKCLLQNMEKTGS